ncbi:MAG: hypothetical protein Q9184_008594 [Pyrenodesmia sp. 2 TL-2023]
MSQSVERPFPFLELTRELRDSVYETLLLSSQSPPPSPEDGGARKYPSKEDKEFFERHNHYPADDLKSTSGPLLGTCRQISEEVEEAMVRLIKSNRPLYRLDLMLLDERELYITWLAFPRSTTEIPRLDRFLQRGPDFLAAHQLGRDMRIGELRVNVLTPPAPPPGGYANKHYRDRTRKGHISPEDMVDFLITYMSILLGRGRHTASYASLVFERIKRMTFTLDGVERMSWELATLEPEYTR